MHIERSPSCNGLQKDGNTVIPPFVSELVWLPILELGFAKTKF